MNLNDEKQYEFYLKLSSFLFFSRKLFLYRAEIRIKMEKARLDVP